MGKLAFIGHYKTFTYHDIGGTNSIVRRLSNSMSVKREIFHLSYGIEVNENYQNINGIHQFHFKDFESMIKFANDKNILNLIVVYLKPLDFIKLLFLRISKKALIFHGLITGLSSNFLKKTIYRFIIEEFLNGRIFCVSKELVTFFKKYEKRVTLLMPPVDDIFFIDSSLQRKKINEKIRIAYMGRIDHGKGSDIAINFFENSTLSQDQFEFYVYGYCHENDRKSVEMHNKLLEKESKINYVQSQVWNAYSPKIDELLSDLIDEVDLFYLPYRTIGSTIDTPLVPLEILSRGGIFLTSDFQQLRDISYDERFILSHSEIPEISIIEERILLLIDEFDSRLHFSFLNQLNFKTSSVASLLERSIF